MSEQLRFGPFSFDPAGAELRKQGVPLRLQPQPARVLAVLVTRAGEVVSREDLRLQIWPEGTYVDFERGLNFCIAQIRSTLGDTAASPRYVETLPKRGYRFVAPVSRLAAPTLAAVPAAVPQPPVDVPPPSMSVPPAPRGRRATRRRIVAASLAVVAVAVVLAIVLLWSGAGREPARVAVVSFDNETGRDAFDAVAVAIADLTVVRLATPERMPRLRVIGSSAALRQPRTFRDIKVIGESVGAEYLVLAQIKSDGDTVRLIAHLIRISDETHLWANTFDRSAFSLAAQAEIAEAIADAVTSRIAG
jgi:DNA-binding winged helix-turn-helix (wHTH) protein/TolB-like protein